MLDDNQLLSLYIDSKSGLEEFNMATDHDIGGCSFEDCSLQSSNLPIWHAVSHPRSSSRAVSWRVIWAHGDDSALANKSGTLRHDYPA